MKKKILFLAFAALALVACGDQIRDIPHTMTSEQMIMSCSTTP